MATPANAEERKMLLRIAEAMRLKKKYKLSAIGGFRIVDFFDGEAVPAGLKTEVVRQIDFLERKEQPSQRIRKQMREILIQMPDLEVEEFMLAYGAVKKAVP